jgi:hypothetical protein
MTTTGSRNVGASRRAPGPSLAGRDPEPKSLSSRCERHRPRLFPAGATGRGKAMTAPRRPGNRGWPVGGYTSGVPGTPADDSGRYLPEWYMPPPMIGGHVTGPVLVSRSDRLVVAVRHVVAFPAGVEVEGRPIAAEQGPDRTMPLDFRDCVSASVLPTSVRQRRTTKRGCAAVRAHAGCYRIRGQLGRPG